MWTGTSVSVLINKIKTSLNSHIMESASYSKDVAERKTHKKTAGN